jgi:ferrous iron transport protein B
MVLYGGIAGIFIYKLNYVVGKSQWCFGSDDSAYHTCHAGIRAPGTDDTGFYFGLFRRDYGAAGLYDLSASGLLTDNQLLIAAVVLTLFLPCVAQFVVMMKERGLIASLCISICIILTSLFAGGILNFAFQILGIG